MKLMCLSEDFETAPSSFIPPCVLLKKKFHTVSESLFSFYKQLKELPFLLFFGGEMIDDIASII